MRVIEYFASDCQEYWRSKIQESDWVAGKFLYNLLVSDGLSEYMDESARVLLLTEEDRLISFCTLSAQDDIAPTDLMPWIGFVYTFPQYRGNRYAGCLIDYASELAKKEGFRKVYISTDQQGIYEKYRFEYMGLMKDRRGGDSMVYFRHI